MINTLRPSIYSLKIVMIKSDQEYFNSPYYFLLRDKGNNYSLYFSSESTLTEARKNDVNIKVPREKVEAVKKYLEKLLKTKKTKSTKEVGGEIEELVTLDGAMSNSSIPILDPALHPRKTMDQTVAASRITNDPISRGYRTYYGESVEVSEEDMSGAFGYEETKDLDGKETYKYFKDELEMEPDEAKERTKQQGKDPYGKRDKKSKFKNDPNFISRQILPEIQKEKAIKMIEDFLMDKKKEKKDKGEINKKEKEEVEVSSILKKNLKSLMRQMDKEGLSKKDIIKLLNSE